MRGRLVFTIPNIVPTAEKQKTIIQQGASQAELLSAALLPPGGWFMRHTALLLDCIE
ncbi:UNVERIFIED_CONTAM: hypothetical protein FKN15_010507 [Acipenser sinensis]